jgi:methylenetetrahydrofolate dehydrogenase (NADP+)/methenyltetrahydrofolate cyclohydrolase
MLIDGKHIAERILNPLEKKISQLMTRGVTPLLSVIQIGTDPASTSYIRQKKLAAERTGIKLKITNYGIRTAPDELAGQIKLLNDDPKIHGIIIQRPLPEHLNVPELLNLVTPRKDVDGFVIDSEFEVPVALAIGEILKEIYNMTYNYGNKITDNILFNWLRTKNITIVGRGETAGKPIAAFLKKHDCATSIIHSGTNTPGKILARADIVVSCVGKEGIIRPGEIKPGCILISVGIWRDREGKIHGDYNEAEIATKSAFYTPTPGGVGPVNIACLMSNTTRAAINKS